MSKGKTMAVFNSNHKAVLDQMLLDIPGVRPGKMFGYPAYYAGQKLSICIVEDGVGVKLPAETAERLMVEDRSITPFQPFGRPKMREWVQINPEVSEDLQGYKDIFTQSIGYVLRIQPGGK
jgi:hypothetical protein